MPNIAIIGAGPAGVFCAYKLLEASDDIEITFFEKNKPLLTILPTGNGRCNLSYDEEDFRELASFYPRGEKFLYSIFSRYGTKDAIYDFKKLGINTYIQEDKRIFPITNKAADVKRMLLNAVKDRVNFIKKDVKKPLTGFDGVVLAVGLKSGADIAKSYGHNINQLIPSLCGLKIKEKEFLTLEGVSINNVVFTNEGVSGPFIYKLSSINAYKNFPYEIKIPLVDTDILEKQILQNPKKMFKTIVSNFIPKSLANILVKTEKQCANTSKKEILDLEFLTLTAISRDNKGEIVHAGGVPLNEVDKNLKSKIAENLWIIGEMLDIDGFTGGFNLQNCWSTAAIAASDILKTFTLADA